MIFLIILLGAWLRFHTLAQDFRLQPDEAWYSTYAREAAINGGWWLPGPLDKTPLAIYATALAQVLAGDSEFAVRLPATLAAIILMPVMAAAARAWYKPSTRFLTIIVTILTALSPYALAYSATVYTDALMFFAMVVALALAGRNRWGWSGVWLGLAFACKQQGIYYVPLLPMLGWAVEELTPRRAIRFAVGSGSVILLLLLWDAARPGDSLFALAAVNSNPDRLIRSAEILPRLRAWASLSQTLLGPVWLTIPLLMTGLIALSVRVIREARRRETLVDLVLLSYILAFAGLHWLIAFNTYDRYLLALLPPLILLAARGLHFLTAQRDVWEQRMLCIFLLLALLPGALDTVEGRSPINNAHEQYTSIDELAAYLNAQPVATVIYDRWLGWELRYYMGQWHDKRMVYYPTPAALVKDALALCEIGPRYFPAPAGQPVGPWLEALQQAGFTITPSYQNLRFVVYQLMPPWQTADDCS